MAFKPNDFRDRAEAAAKARQAAAEKFRNRPTADDPEVQKRIAERQAIAAARDIRMAERQSAKEAELERLKRDDLVRIAAEAAAAEAARIAAEDRAARDEAIRAERKAARDAKYAARKARK